jgi:hypothetical protein
VAASVITTCTVAPALIKLTRQLGRLVAGHATRQAQHEVLAQQFVQAIGC